MCTFADLMSLLLCFFILIVSFSTQDAKRFYDMVGSMKDAFGLQKQTMASGMIEVSGVPYLPKVSTLAPVPISTLALPASDWAQPDLGEGDEGATDDSEEVSERTAPEADKAARPQAVRSEMQSRNDHSPGQGEPPRPLAARPGEAARAGGRTGHADGGRLETEGQREAGVGVDQHGLTDRNDPREDQVLKLLNAALAPEISHGITSVEARDGKIKITFPERSAFASGSDTLDSAIYPVLDKVAAILAQTSGAIEVYGHTDNVPISTARFPSNWELSAARAISVMRRVAQYPGVDGDRLTVIGFADTRPLGPNDTAESRAQNRRVEVILKQSN